MNPTHPIPDPSPAPPLRREQAECRWDAVPLLAYKAEDSAPFAGITRQLLFREPALGCELRYFEVEPGGHSTLERHQHAHAVMVLRGQGRVLLGDRVHAIAGHDLVHIPGGTWHQFRADADAPLGFLCMVNTDRDRPQLPDADALAALRSNAAVAAFVRP
jgi:quercetin dioxygenase-like cupin family protein